MALINTLCILMVNVYLVQAYYYPSRCTCSADCGRGQCCRGTTGQVIGGDTTRPPMTGICAGLNNNLQPLDDGCGCNCDRGFLCYREITGVCCAPSTCSDADYVRERQAFWKNCFSNPNCALPPVSPPQEGAGLNV